MKTVLALALVAASFAAVPAAADGCDPTGSVCDSNYADGSCSPGSEYGYESHSTTGPGFSGSSYCSQYGEYGNSGSSFDAAGVVGWSTFAYNDPETGQGSGCAYFVAGQILPCVVSPPSPWGHVLP